MWFLAAVIGGSIAAEVGAGAFQMDETQKIADEIEKAQGEWAIVDAYVDGAMSWATDPIRL